MNAPVVEQLEAALAPFRGRALWSMLARLVMATVLALLLWRQGGLESVAGAAAMPVVQTALGLATAEDVLSNNDEPRRILQFSVPSTIAKGVALVELKVMLLFAILVPALLLLAAPLGGLRDLRRIGLSLLFAVPAMMAVVLLDLGIYAIVVLRLRSGNDYLISDETSQALNSLVVGFDFLLIPLALSVAAWTLAGKLQAGKQ